MQDHLPEQINTEEKQCNVAKSIAMLCYGKQAVSSKLVSLQGTASITLEVALEDHPDVIIQFRTEPLDITPFVTARQLLGNAVPSIEIFQDNNPSMKIFEDVKDTSIYCLVMTKMSGEPWFEIEDDWKDDSLINAATSLGAMISSCFVPNDDESIDRYIIPKLKGILTMETRSGINVSHYFPLIESLIAASSRLRDLPGFFTHPDLNPMNIFANKSGNVEGIIDWDDSLVLPFGISGWAIHFLAGQFLTLDNGEIGFVERPIYELMERSFWEALLKNAPKEVRNHLRDKMHLLQLAMIIGTVIKILGIYKEDGVEISDLHVPSLKALPTLLKYRVPFVRGATEKPFGNAEFRVQL